MRSSFFCGDSIVYNDSGTNQFMLGGWIRPHLALDWMKVVLNVSIKTESLDDPHICVDCLSSVYTRLGKDGVDMVFSTEGKESDN